MRHKNTEFRETLRSELKSVEDKRRLKQEQEQLNKERGYHIAREIEAKKKTSSTSCCGNNK